MNETITQNLPNDGDGFVRELAARLMMIYVSKKGVKERNIDLEIPTEIIKQCVWNAENLYEALYKHHV